MFDLGFMELMVIGVVALIVVGPKDLPGMFRTVGNFVGKAKRMAREFSNAMNDAADEAGVKDVTKTLKAAADPVRTVADEARKSSTSFIQETMDSGKPKLSPERQEAKEKISQRAAELANERLAKEAAEKQAAEAQVAEKTTPEAAADKAPSKKTLAKAASKPKAKAASKKTSPAKTARKAAAKDEA